MRADSAIKTLADTTPSQSIAYSTSGSSSHNIVVAFGQELGAKAKATATGVVVNTYQRAGAIEPGSFEFDQPTDAELERRRRLER